MYTMKHLLVFILSATVFHIASGQVVVNYSNPLYQTGGSFFPVMGALPSTNTSQFELSKGSPFYKDEWTLATLINEKGQSYKNVPVKVDLFQNNILFRDSAGRELIIGTPLREVRFTAGNADKLPHFINGNILPNAKKGWFQLLVNDSISLIRESKKAIEQHTSYGSAPEYSMVTTESYFVYYGNKEYEVRKPADLISIIPGKENELQGEAKKLGKLKSREEQLVAITTFANTLLRKTVF